MAEKKHKDLASAIKNVHQTLRLEARKVGEEKAWLEHCGKTDVLQNYAKAMRQLATEFWEKNAIDEQNKGAVSRVQWTVEQCEKYFFMGGSLDAFNKEISLCRKFNVETNEIAKSLHGILRVPQNLKVLDVGSCYNPFQKFSKFDVVAVDIAPASNDVYECDFLNLKVLEKGDTSQNAGGKIAELVEGSFDVVVFSLLLEYFPSCKQRYTCCSKASKLLAPAGILCIITPDSKHATANSGIMKRWRYALANEGLLRIEYDKLPHLHCMVFRKCVHPLLAKEWLSSSLSTENRKGKNFSDPPEELMVIPQDFQCYSEKDERNVVDDVREEDEAIASAFADLPEL
ncbi:hypothetical protein ONE63_001371 [Megalurothrips usitatus]|uniref:S-adenosylmethionine sensor upstream of mTORC1 n=1 Tax=Megalurothrips usitatus TaxID=439358 RepID=A0AAV7XBV5_9NEOP|nr:hypothetical protein ONE63_001371 [Megalurothrips usitatus]KAJ1523520.1 hypothetical protein ONE63_001371 [Megalurothrips usitatus]